jgi:hypothetical protein
MLTGFFIIRENRIAEKCKLVSAIFCPFLIFLMGMAMTRNLEAEEAGPLRLIQTIPLRNVEGRIDHMAVDLISPKLRLVGEVNGESVRRNLRTIILL